MLRRRSEGSRGVPPPPAFRAITTYTMAMEISADRPDGLSDLLRQVSDAGRGDAAGLDQGKLEDLLGLCRRGLPLTSRTTDPRAWAALQGVLGRAAFLLGSARSDEALPRESAEAFGAALDAYARDREPVEWALAQRGLGASPRSARRPNPAMRPSVATRRPASRSARRRSPRSSAPRRCAWAS